jgi:hypothetical protein
MLVGVAKIFFAGHPVSPWSVWGYWFRLSSWGNDIYDCGQHTQVDYDLCLPSIILWQVLIPHAVKLLLVFWGGQIVFSLQITAIENWCTSTHKPLRMQLTKVGVFVNCSNKIISGWNFEHKLFWQLRITSFKGLDIPE